MRRSSSARDAAGALGFRFMAFTQNLWFPARRASPGVGYFDSKDFKRERLRNALRGDAPFAARAIHGRIVERQSGRGGQRPRLRETRRSAAWRNDRGRETRNLRERLIALAKAADCHRRRHGEDRCRSLELPSAERRAHRTRHVRVGTDVQVRCGHRYKKREGERGEDRDHTSERPAEKRAAHSHSTRTPAPSRRHAFAPIMIAGQFACERVIANE